MYIYIYIYMYIYILINCIRYVTIKDSKYVKNNSVNPSYVIFSKVNRHFEENNKRKVFDASSC